MDNKYKSNVHIVYENFYDSNRKNKNSEEDFYTDLNSSLKQAQKLDEQEKRHREQADKEFQILNLKIDREERNKEISDFCSRETQKKMDSLRNLCKRKQDDDFYDD